MSKALKIAAIVVGVAAVIVTGGAALGLLPAFIPALGISTALLGTILSVTATVLSLAAGLLAKPPKPRIAGAGQQLEWSADPASGEPYVVGNAMVGASIVHQATWGDKNKFLGIVGVLSVMTLTGYDGLYTDMTAVTFSGGNATGYYANFLYQQTQLGALPEGSALAMTAPGGSTMPDWGSAYKTSGLGTVGLILVADVDKGKVYSGGVPKLTSMVRGVKTYDPRADSTQSGGSGSQRTLTESTYAYSENPWVHAVTYALGRFQQGVRVIGPGLPADKIDMAAFMEAATIADANGWKASGMVLSTDPKWDCLRAMCQAGGGYPMPTAAHLSCLVNAPKVSLETINESDVKGAVTAPQMLPRRNRLNGAIPRCRVSTQGWEVTPLTAVRNSTWLADDGGNASTKEFEFALVADNGDGAGKAQAAQLAAYEVANSRERVGISVELGYQWSQYKLGDCLTLNLPSANLVNQKCVVIGRTINPAHNTVTLVFRTEDDAKHTWALGVTGTVTAPPTVAQTPGAGDNINQTTAEITQLIANSYVIGLTFSVDSVGNFTVSNHTRVYADKSVSVTGGTVATGANAAGDMVWIFYDDPTRAGGAVSYQDQALTSAGGDASGTVASAANPYRHQVLFATIPGGGGTTSGGSDPGSGGGAYNPYCVTVDTPLLYADGIEREAGNVAAGDIFRTQHEHTLEWGEFEVEAVKIVEDQPVWLATIDGRALRATGDHRVWLGGCWQRMRDIGEPAGRADVAQITVADAHTYVSNGILSHNIKPDLP